ncbi:MAG: DUF6020 family protein [Bifidobacterium sp.]|uniref:DUF6020 family protein n=1 Tax=Bifidobacterium fermentum TaxID=3059035 RepID=A0AB39UHM0_9BIFI
MSSSQHDMNPRSQSILAGLRWACVALACLWIAFCTSVGPIYRADASIASYSWGNALILIVTFTIDMVIVLAVVRWAKGRRNGLVPNDGAATTNPSDAFHGSSKKQSRLRSRLHSALLSHRSTRSIARFTTRRWSAISPWIMRLTATRSSLFLVFAIGWLWAFATLLAAYGADIHSQINEFNLWWANLQGVRLPYLHGFTQMDIYPTGHYLWPHKPTYLTDQHNYLLTLFYGGVVAVFRKLSGSDDAGIVVLTGLQMLFAAFCCASTADRFFNAGKPRINGKPASAGARLAILALFLLTPLSAFSTISLTKSPAFAYSFVWWIGILYVLYRTAGRGEVSTSATRWPPKRLCAELAISSLLMIGTAKYGIYVVAVQIILSVLADRRRWKTYALCLLVPTVAFEALLMSLISAGAVIQGDPIEAKGIQLQQIARVAERDPENIPASARRQLEPILDLQAMALKYNPNDADPVKSSGGETKVTVYKWRTVTADDMKHFNSAWLSIGLRNPVLYIDAFMAECYGYFDVTDVPYVSMNYYVNNGYVQDSSAWIKNWMHGWRDRVAGFAFAWGRTPVIGWLTNANFWLVLSLLLLCIEFALGRFRALSYQTTLLVLMGVMIFAPANNYDRHILPLVFVFGFLTLAFVRDTDELPTTRAPELGEGGVDASEKSADITQTR